MWRTFFQRHQIAAVATPDPHHPSSQGFVQALGVFIDTILICTATALMILLSGVMVPGNELTGTPLTQAAMSVHIGGAGQYFIAVAILFFAIGFLQRDGVCILLGHLSNIATIIYFAILIGGGAVAIQKAWEALFA